jgi:hypothetical protein
VDWRQKIPLLMFAKVFAQIFDSSIAEDHTIRHVFMDLLVLADVDGVIDMTKEAISRRTNVPLEIITKSIDVLCAPDVASRSKDEDGRRLMPIDSRRPWGWQVVNYHRYRGMKDEESRRAYYRDYRRQERAKKTEPKKPPTKEYHEHQKRKREAQDARRDAGDASGIHVTGPGEHAL